MMLAGLVVRHRLVSASRMQFMLFLFLTELNQEQIEATSIPVLLSEQR